MTKTLSESAAEILKASMASAGKVPMASMNAQVNDLGGATPTNDYNIAAQNGQEDEDESIGTATERDIAVAPKPRVGVAPQMPMQSIADEPEEAIDSEEEMMDDNDAEQDDDDRVDESTAMAKNIANSIVSPELKKKGLIVRTHNAEDIGADEIGHKGRVHIIHHKDDDGEGDYAAVSHDKKSNKYVVSHTIMGSAGGEGPAKKFSNPEDAIKYGQKFVLEQVEQVDDEEEGKRMMKKEMVEKYRGSMREDVDALFNGESLSEDFRVKATLIFESAVQNRVEQIIEDVLGQNDEILESAIEEIKEEMANQVDEYLNYVVEEWVGENEVAIETGLRAELSENFISGLKTLFEEHYVEIPDEKLDIAEELATQVAELEEAVLAFVEENESLSEQVNSVKKAKATAQMCEDLTSVQAEKMKSLAESVEFTTEGDFDNKLAVLRENYFPSKTNVISEVRTLQENTIHEDREVVEISNARMARYVQSISKTAPKA